MNSQSSSSKMKDVLVKPLVSAAVAGIATKMIIPEAYMTVMNTKLSTPLAIAGGVYLSSAVVSALHDYVFPLISPDERFASIAGIVEPASTGLVNVALTGISSNALSEKSPVTFFLIGGGSDILGTYLWDHVLSAWI